MEIHLTETINYQKVVGSDGLLFKCTGDIDFTMIVYYTGEYVCFSTELESIQSFIVDEIIKHEGLLISD